MTPQQVELSAGPDPGARFPGSTVDFSGTGDWSFPPAFPWSDTPPPGVTLRKKEDQSQEWRRAPSAACAVVADAPRRFADVSDAQLTLGGPGHYQGFARWWRTSCVEPNDDAHFPYGGVRNPV